MHELAVRDPVLLTSRGDPHDPQRPEIALLTLAAGVGELEPALDGLLSGPVQFALG